MQKIRPDMDIGKNIQSIRYANKLTQDQVIAKLNLMGISMSKSTYAKLETNRMNIKISELVALAKIFHTDINAFFSGLDVYKRQLCNCLFRSLPMEKLLFPLHTRNSHIPVLQTLPVLSLLRSGK